MALNAQILNARMQNAMEVINEWPARQFPSLTGQAVAAPSQLFDISKN
jgi:hypothetical protein